MLNSKTTLLLVLLMSFSLTLTGCAGIGAIFSGLLDGVMASFGDLFTVEGFTGFLGNVLGGAAQELGPQLAEGNVDGGDIWGAVGGAAVNQLKDQAGDIKGNIKDGVKARREEEAKNKAAQDAKAKAEAKAAPAKDTTTTQGQADDKGGSADKPIVDTKTEG